MEHVVARTGVTIVGGCGAGDACGVWDYSVALAEALRAEGIDPELVNASDWSARGFLRTVKRLRSSKEPVVMQFPSVAFLRRLLPFALPLLVGRPVVATIHEFSRRGLPSKLLTSLIFLRADRFAFTNSMEAERARRWFPWIGDRSTIIPIGNAIGTATARARDIDCAYFGILRSNGQIERFLEIVRGIKRPGLRCCIVGRAAKGEEQYVRSLMQEAQREGIEVVVDADDAAVASLLARSKVAILPFADGISSRRTTVLAAMGNGALVISTPPAPEESFFQGLALIGATDAELTAQAEQFLKRPELFEAVRDAASAYAARHSWPAIARSYVDVIEQARARSVRA